MKKFYLVYLLFFALIFGKAQAQGIGIGQWQTHLPYQKVIDVAEGNSLIYAATPYSLFTYNPADNRVIVIFVTPEESYILFCFLFITNI